jgi:hypothetical protein
VAAGAAWQGCCSKLIACGGAGWAAARYAAACNHIGRVQLLAARLCALPGVYLWHKPSAPLKLIKS